MLAAMDRKGVSELLRVTVRTVKNWEQGKSRVPYSAYRLLRIHGCYDLPGAAWSGWRLAGDTLWSPERRGFRPFDLAWWGLTVAMAREWKRIYAGSSVSGNEIAAQLTITAADVLPGGLLSVDKRPPLHGGEAQGGGVDAALPHDRSNRPQAGEPGVCRSGSSADGEAGRTGSAAGATGRGGSLTSVSDK